MRVWFCLKGVACIVLQERLCEYMVLLEMVPGAVSFGPFICLRNIFLKHNERFSLDSSCKEMPASAKRLCMR